MTRAPPLIGALILLLSACGGNEPSTRLVLQADLAQLPPGADPAAAIGEVASIIEGRLRAYGVAGFELELLPPNRLALHAEGITVYGARDLLLPTGLMELRQPQLNVDGQILCRAPDGALFTAAPLQVMVSTSAEGRRQGLCVSNYAGSGEVLWEPAAASDSQGNVRTLTSAFLEPGTARVESEPQRSVAFQFNDEGARLLEQITARLVGFPLAFFLDERLLAAPMVIEPISGGSAAISGLSAEEARTLAAQLAAGPLPLPLRIAP